MEALEDTGLLSKEMLLAGDIPSVKGDGPDDDEDHLRSREPGRGREATGNRGPSIDVGDHLRVAGTGPTEIAKPFGFGRTSTLRC